MKRRKMSKAARGYIGRKVQLLTREGYPKKQAVAIAYTKARRAGYKIPRKRKR